jgi:aspartate aminotransferase
LVDKGVAVVPGTAFGLKNHMRLSIATSEENLRNALIRIAEFLS